MTSISQRLREIADDLTRLARLPATGDEVRALADELDQKARTLKDYRMVSQAVQRRVRNLAASIGEIE